MKKKLYITVTKDNNVATTFSQYNLIAETLSDGTDNDLFYISPNLYALSSKTTPIFVFNRGLPTIKNLIAFSNSIIADCRTYSEEDQVAVAIIDGNLYYDYIHTAKIDFAKTLESYLWDMYEVVPYQFDPQNNAIFLGTISFYRDGPKPKVFSARKMVSERVVQFN